MAITKRELLLLQLAYLNQVYKSDFIMLMNDASNSSSTIRAMKKREWILEYKVTKLGPTKQETSVIAISYEGRRYLMKKFNDKYYIEVAKEMQRKFNTDDLEKLHRRLIDNRLKVSMMCSGTLTLLPDKPSLRKIYSEITDEAIIDDMESVSYDNGMSADETLSNGVYYSYEEILHFIELVRGQNDYDTILGSRFRGVYIDSNKTVFCYIPRPNNNRRIRLTENIEMRAIETMSKYLSKLNGVTDVDALVISSRDTLVEKMCASIDNGNERYINLLDWNNDLYEHIYVVPYNRDGMKSLRYLRKYSYEKWINDSNKAYEKTPIDPIKNITGNPYLTGRNKINDRRAIFLPFYDIKLLLLLKTFHDDVDIVTLQGMVDTIANVVRRNNAYYDMNGAMLAPNYKKEIEEKQTKYVKHFRSKSVGLSLDDIKKIKTICTAHGISQSSYIRSKVRSSLDEDYEAAKQKLENQKKIRKIIRGEN